MQSNKPTQEKHFFVPEAIKEMQPVKKRSKLGNEYTMWTESWFTNAIRGKIREIFHQWPVRKQVLDRVRVVEPTLTKKGLPSKRPAVWHICEECGQRCKAVVSKKNPKGYKRIWVDHIEPVVPPGQNIGFDEYEQRVFCAPENLQALCDDCHRRKTNKERSERMRYAKSGKTASWRR